MSPATKRTIVVAGGSSASGINTAAAFSQAGFKVYTVGSNRDRIAAAASQAGAEVVAKTCDLSDFAAVQKLGAEILAEAGRIDGLMHLVGGWRGGKTLAEQSDEDWDFLHRQCVGTLRNTSRAFYSALVDTGGRFAIISSTALETPTAGGANYNAAKAAAEVWTQGVAQGFGQEAGGQDHGQAAATIFRVKALLDNDMIAAHPERKFPGFTHVSQVAQSAVGLFDQAAEDVNGRTITLPAHTDLSPH
ncbi:SDR family oxidoreductase [Pseudarthrobacter sp. J1738]|uniref:SDR family oxidoreductase n=1 Tax=Pseudarthrobacter sp. J1738 TaxID=3420446 RepID=UPI003D28CFAA